MSLPVPPPYLDAVKLVGLLADDDRRRVVAALVLGAADSAAVVAATDLSAARVGRAVARLEDAGLVERGRDGTLVLIGQAFAHAARAAGAASAASESDRAGIDLADPSAVAVSRFMRDGRLVSIPAARGKRLAVLEVLSEEFEPGRRYSESMVNLILGRWHPDTAALRRYLVDEGFLDREAGQYWRVGGPFAV